MSETTELSLASASTMLIARANQEYWYLYASNTRLKRRPTANCLVDQASKSRRKYDKAAHIARARDVNRESRRRRTRRTAGGERASREQKNRREKIDESRAQLGRKWTAVVAKAVKSV